MLAVKVGLYARVSSDRQAQEKTIDSQIALILQHAESHQVCIDPNLQFIDNGVSGSTLERPGLDRLRDKALQKEVTNIYVLSPDRLSRKSGHQMLLIDEMNRLGVSFTFVNRHIGDSPEDQMLLQMQGIIAEYEREKIMERSRRGKLFAAKGGKVSVLSGAPFGYRYHKVTAFEDASYTIDNDEAEIVREAFDLYCLEGLSMHGIARVFNEKNYVTSRGKSHWTQPIIFAMLKNPAYKGTAAFRKTKRIPRLVPANKKKAAPGSRFLSMKEKSTKRPIDEWIYISVPAIIEDRKFTIAQQKLVENKKHSSRNNKKNHYLLSGLLRCSICGYAVYGRASVDRGVRLYYRCIGQDGPRWPQGRICKGRPVKVKIIDELVWDSIRCLLLNPEIIEAEFERRLGSHQDSLTTIIEQKQTEAARFMNERSRLIDLFQMGLVEKKEVEPKLKALGAKIDQAQSEKQYLQQQQNEQQKLLTVINNLADFSARINKNMDEHSFEERKKIIRLLVAEVEVDSIEEKINIKHIIPFEPQKYPLCNRSHGRTI